MVLIIIIKKIQFIPPPRRAGPDTPLTKKYIFSISLNKYKKINIYNSNVYLV